MSHSQTFKKRCALLYSCSLVSSEWRPWAEGELSEGRVFIFSSETASKLVRTLENDPRWAQVKSLCFGIDDSQLTPTALKTYELLKLCSRLREFSLRGVYDFKIPWLAMVPCESAWE